MGLLRPSFLERAFDHGEELLDCERLHQIVRSPNLHGLDGCLHRGEPRDENHDDFRIGRLRDPENVESPYLRHPQIGDHDVETGGPKDFLRQFPGRGLDDLIPPALERRREGLEHGRVVFNDEDTFCHHKERRSGAHSPSTRTGMSNSGNSSSFVKIRIVPWNLPGWSRSLMGTTLSSKMPVSPWRGMLTTAPGPSGGVFSTPMNGREDSTRIRKSCP